VKRNILIISLITILFSLLFISCESLRKQSKDTDLTIFFINDNHSQIDNFSKINSIIDDAEKNGNVILASSGDIFSGNPIVDYYSEKGYPVIDLMNRIGFDVMTLGNHEFDYGQEVLQDRIDQAEFEIICANMISESPLLEQTPAAVTISAGGLNISFVGVIETNGKPGAVIPSTHPNKLNDLTFTDAKDILDDYSAYKDDENSDLLILLSHLGHYYEGAVTSDYSVAHDFPFFDAIIGGHSHSIEDTTINGVHIYQAGAYLNYLGKISLKIKDRKIVSEDFELIDLEEYQEKDEELHTLIETYNSNPAFSEVIGINDIHLTRNRTVGCFYTNALRGYLNTDLSFQNPGGIRSDLDVGDISIMEIYRIDPFNNGLLKYEITVHDIKAFLEGTGEGFYYSGAIIEHDPVSGIIIRDQQGNIHSDDQVLSIAINDYIPAVYEEYFPEPVNMYDLTTADAMIQYVRNLAEPLSYDSCSRYFRYEE